MANAKKCDRCGEYYDTNLCRVKPHEFSKGPITPTYLSMHSKLDCTKGIYDLCDCCWDDFMKFITGTPIVSEEEEE